MHAWSYISESWLYVMVMYVKVIVVNVVIALYLEQMRWLSAVISGFSSDFQLVVNWNRQHEHYSALRGDRYLAQCRCGSVHDVHAHRRGGASELSVRSCYEHMHTAGWWRKVMYWVRVIGERTGWRKKHVMWWEWYALTIFAFVFYRHSVGSANIQKDP